MNIKNKVVIVTGASSGIGLATAKLLWEKGAKVVLAARSLDKLTRFSKTITGSIAVCADMTKKEDIKKMIDKTLSHFGRVDILINNAGQGYDALIEQIDTEVFRKLFELNVLGPLIAMQQVISVMKKQKEGMIINISSGTALMSLSSMAAYSSLKRALVGISLTAREELKSYNILVSVVYPYITITDFEKNTIKAKVKKFENKSFDKGLNPSDSASYVAGIILDGIKNEEPEIYAHDWMKKVR